MMEAISVYLYKSAICITAFTLIYLLFLKNERFFNLKRSYLVSGIIASLVIPLIVIRYEVVLSYPASQFSIMDGAGESGPVTVDKSLINLKSLAGLIYLSGLIFLFARIIWHVILLSSAIRKSEKLRIGKARIIRTNTFPTSFSFLNFIFINPSIGTEEGREIINHELVHVNQKHWFDLLLGEVMRLIQWANPFAWIYAGFIRLNHEHLADRIALGKSADPAIYKSAILNQLFRSPVITLSNNFSNSPVLTRFEMMKNKITSPYRKMKVLLILPVLAFILYSFATPVYTFQQQQVQSVNVIRGIVQDEKGNPLAGAIISIEGSQNGAIADVNGRFVISNVNAGAKIIFSSRGFSNESRVAEMGKDMVIQLKKEIVAEEYSREVPIALIIIDGRKTNRNELKEIDPNIIESMSVLKDKSATAVYGAEGKDGVIIITTKQGEVKKENETHDVPVNASKKEKDTDSDKEVVVVGYAKSRTEGSIKIAGPEGSDNPLFIVNGIKTSRKDLEGIDPNTIDAIAVLKDQSSVAVYGEEGKNGVIIVTTKKAENKNSNEPVEVIGYSQQQGNVKVDSTFTKVDEMPVYPGGDKALLEYITSNIKYPESLRAQKITGKVYVRFAVSAEGKTEQVSILKGVHPALDAEAYRVVSSLKGWTPAKREGKPVSVWYMVPVEFSLLDASRTLVPQDKPGSSGMSRDSELEILKFLGQNSQYPYAARKDGVTGKIFVKVTVANGKIRSNASPSKEEDMNVPFLPEVVIVGYRSNDANPNDLRPDPKGRAASNAGIDVLEKEAERVTAMLKQVDVPDLKKDGEFGVVLNYTLK